MRTLLAAAVIVGLSGAAWAQEGKRDGERERKNKDVSIGLKDIDTNGDGRAQVSELQVAIARLAGNKEGAEKKRDRREEGSIALKDVDSNNDGKATLPELQAALEKAREGGDRKEEGKKKRD
jgi:hypothetical protein